MDNKNNTGVSNSGNYNSGNYNSGNYNSGYRNSGGYNSGYRNSGGYNSGYRNSCDYNSGNYNSGNRNSGNRNSCDYNSGDYNSGNYNSGDYNSGFFNTDEPTVRLFNKETNLKRSELVIPYIDLLVTEWIPDSEMTDQQKANDKDFHIKGGTLIKRTYKEAWTLFWKTAKIEVRTQFLNLPNFDAEIFKEITGIDVSTPKKETCEGKTVLIDGVEYILQLK